MDILKYAGSEIFNKRPTAVKQSFEKFHHISIKMFFKQDKIVQCSEKNIDLISYKYY